MKELLKKLSEVKKEIGAISKDSENPFFKSKYFDINKLIEQVEPKLEAHGLLLMQPIEANNVISVIYEVETGDKVQSMMKLPELNDPQKMGSAITYYRRYTLQSLLALQAEDDDGNRASVAPPKPKLKPNTPEWSKAIEYLKGNGNITTIRAKYYLEISDEKKLKEESL